MSTVLLKDYDTTSALVPEIVATGMPVDVGTVLGSPDVPEREVVLLFGEVAPDFRLTHPIPVSIEREKDGTYVVSDEIFAVYGTGDSERKALVDYAVSLRDFYEVVCQEANENPKALPLAEKLNVYLSTTLLTDAFQAAST